MSRFEGKNVVITGGSGGIGKVTAKDFLLEGANVALVDISQEALDESREDLKEFGRVITIVADVTQEEDVKQYVQKTLDEFSGIDIFFNNAGIEGKVAPIHEQSFVDFTKVLDVNVNGVFLGMKYVVPVMLEAGRGSIINMASVAGLDGSPGMSPYNASKHAVVGLTKAAALELAADNIRVNSVHPSPVNTRMMRAVEEGMGSSQEDMSLSIPIGRYAESSDISNLVLFLADDASDFITGVQYRVDGGMGV